MKVHPGLLKDVTIVELGRNISGPYCAKLLADLGATVLKVEPLDGEPARFHGPFPNGEPNAERSGLFLYLNTNKLGMTLNAGLLEGRTLLLSLLEKSDVFVHNFQPAEAAALGLTYASLAETFPRLVVTAITPYGQTGPYADYAATDLTTAALGGVNAGIGQPDRPPLFLPYGQSGYQAGVVGAIGTLTALLSRIKTGRGQLVDVAEADVWATIHTGVGIVGYIFSGRLRKRAGHRLVGIPYPHTVLPCKDGYVILQASEARQWKRFLEMIGNPEWAGNPRYQDRLANNEIYADELDALLSPWLMDHTRDEIFSLCRQYQIPGAPLKTIDEVACDPQLTHRCYFVEMDHPAAGRLRYPGSAYVFSNSDGRPWRPAPTLGEHDSEVLSQRLGLSQAQLASLRNLGVIRK